jgi:putative cardiolipin synthase
MKYWLLLFSIFTLNLKAGELDPFRASIQSSHQITLLNQGLASFEERLQMIEKAQKSIDVEYFIYNLDKSGRIFSQALIKKSHEGVRVRMLLDYFMVKGQFSPFFAYEMEKNGIEVKYFNVTSTLNLFGGQYRNHRYWG